MPRANVEVVNAHALLLVGNAILMFVGTAGLGMSLYHKSLLTTFCCLIEADLLISLL